jgi:hypothetical protein
MEELRSKTEEACTHDYRKCREEFTRGNHGCLPLQKFPGGPEKEGSCGGAQLPR